jgi:protein-L-isoaspartate(D-aspartate) O-methyltransferase
MTQAALGEARRDGRCEELLCRIRDEARLVSPAGAIDERVLDAMRRVPRECFVDACEEEHAYANIPLPIGFGQTISQPFIVAFMTDLAKLCPASVVLEVGTGSGYQAAVLATLARRVYSIERIPELARRAEERLRSLGYANVEVRQGNGALGWPEHAPFDAILVTAAAPRIPPALIRQLGAGGRMVIPVGAAWAGQDLLLVEKSADGEITVENVLPVAFVPLEQSA